MTKPDSTWTLRPSPGTRFSLSLNPDNPKETHVRLDYGPNKFFVVPTLPEGVTFYISGSDLFLRVPAGVEYATVDVIKDWASTLSEQPVLKEWLIVWIKSYLEYYARKAVEKRGEDPTRPLHPSLTGAQSPEVVTSRETPSAKKLVAAKVAVPSVEVSMEIPNGTVTDTKEVEMSLPTTEQEEKSNHG